MFSQMKARRPGAPEEGTTRVRPSQTVRFGVPARAVRPLGFAAIAVAAAVAVAGCKPGTYSGASSTGSHSGTTSSGSAFSLAAQQTQSIRSFTAVKPSRSRKMTPATRSPDGSSASRARSST